MAVEHAIRALRERWEDVLAQLDQERQRQLRDLMGRLGGPGHAQAVNDLGDFLVDELPSDHPVRRALVEENLFAPAALDWAVFKAEFASLDLKFPDDQPAAIGGTVLAQVVERLLRVPALTEEEVRSRGVEPRDPALIRLGRPDGGLQWPEFQFAPDGGLLPVVRAVNEVLDAAHDPVGAADWWVSGNAWLDGQPSRLIGLIPDDYLVRAARALSAEV